MPEIGGEVEIEAWIEVWNVLMIRCSGGFDSIYIRERGRSGVCSRDLQCSAWQSTPRPLLKNNMF